MPPLGPSFSRHDRRTRFAICGKSIGFSGLTSRSSRDRFAASALAAMILAIAKAAQRPGLPQALGAMKSSLIVLTVALVGCASSFRILPAMVDLTVVPPAVRCDSAGKEVRTVIQVKNNGRGILKFWVWNSAEAPYKIAWHSYEVLDASGEVNLDHGPDGHGPVGSDTLLIGPGDSTTVWVPIYQVTPNMHLSEFKVQLEDQDGSAFTTSAFAPCLR